MKAGKASGTAMMVAYMRALADAGASHLHEFHDPTAHVFLNARWTARLEKHKARLRAGGRSYSLEFARTMGDMMALRTATIDAAVREAIAGGTRQLVILGAGFDGRAWRMKELAGVRVLEVDHPATQTVKREHHGALPPAIADVTFVAVNFEQDSLDSALARAGHDPARPTCWIWEGVVMYLTRDAMLATLATVAALSAAGSTLIVNYHTEMRRGLMRLILSLMGEPVRSKWSPAEMAADLQAAGFEAGEDSGVAEWAKRYADGVRNVGAGRIMRIVVAHRPTHH